MAKKSAHYDRIVAHIFAAHHRPPAVGFAFRREEIETAATALGVPRPKNLGDVVSTFRYRKTLSDSIRAAAPKGKEWIIRPGGPGRYRFALVRQWQLSPNPAMARIKAPAATPGIMAQPALSGERALLAILRYNRLVDTFTGVTRNSLQNHRRTAVPDLGQVETDDIDVGVDRQGAHHAMPVQAKGGRDRLSRLQIEQDIAMRAAKFSQLICQPIAAQFVADALSARFEFELDGDELRVRAERHYRRVDPDQISAAELLRYRTPTA